MTNLNETSTPRHVNMEMSERSLLWWRTASTDAQEKDMSACVCVWDFSFQQAMRQICVSITNQIVVRSKGSWR